MTKFEDQLFDDLIREHGPALANARRPAPRQHMGTRRALLAVGGGGLAVAAAAGALVATGSTSAPGHSATVGAGSYALTTHPNGAITLAVYQKSGIAAANAKLRELGDSRVYVVPVAAGCPSISSLPAPAVPLNGKHLSMSTGISAGGAVTVNAKGIPAGDILVVGVQVTKVGSMTASLGAGKLTTAPPPSCVSLPTPPAPPSNG
ncbi:MAG TPA: hypothetical protein VHZ33_07450 [Trebonia sp.]|jgi:hypothetical protein|nr:hypothetical protein [Trebonia sp.]